VYLGFSAVYTLIKKKQIFVYILCHGLNTREERCKNKILFIGSYRKLTDIVKFEIATHCEVCGHDYSMLKGGGIRPGKRTAEKWIEIARREATRYAHNDVEDCMRDDKEKLVHLPANLRHKVQHSGRKRKEKNLWQVFSEGA